MTSPPILRAFEQARLLCVMVAVGVTSGCDITCTAVGAFSIVADVRDGEGRPAAIGATVRIEDQDGYVDVATGIGDPLTVRVGDDARSGWFDVTVSRPWHAPATLHHVLVGDARCGIQAAAVEVVLPLLENAPPIRQVVAPPGPWVFLAGNYRDHLAALVVTEEGITEEVAWVARDTTVIHLEPDGSLVTRCRDDAGATWAVAHSTVDPTVKDSTLIEVFADDDPNRCPSA